MAKDEGLLLGDAARAVGVSVDTLRRWARTYRRRDAARIEYLPHRAGVNQLVGGSTLPLATALLTSEYG